MSTIELNGKEIVFGSSFSLGDPVAPKDPYAISKWDAEQGLLTTTQTTGLEVVIIGPLLVYGPSAKGNFASLIKWVKNGVSLLKGPFTICDR